MVMAFEIALAGGVAVVVASTAAVIWLRIPERPLVAATFVLGAVAAASGVAALIALTAAGDDARSLAVTCAGLALAAAAEAGLIWLRRWLSGVDAIDEALAKATSDIDSRLDAHRRTRATELGRTLTKERAESAHLLAEQERELGAVRREAVELQAAEAAAALAARTEIEQARHSQRLSEWSADLDRQQRELRDRLDALVADQASALDVHRTRIAQTATELRDLSTEQHEALESLRSDFRTLAAEATAESRAEIEVSADHARNDLSVVNERLRDLTRALREEADHEETEARARLAQSASEIERQVTERFQRSLDRSSDRLAENAEQRFDAQIRASREDTTQRLTRELERTLQHFTREMEKEVEGQMNEVANVTAARLQRQLDAVLRQSEAEATLAEERIAFISKRLDKTLDDAAGRLAVFETDLERELTTKMAEFERAVRHAAQTVDHDTR